MSKIAVIDCDSLAFSIFAGNKVLDEFGVPKKEDNKFIYTNKTEQEMRDSADYLFNKIFKDTKCTGYIAYIKGKNTIKQKLEINPLYKQNRPKGQPEFWDFVKNDLVERYNVIVVNNYEVDDFVNVTRLTLKDSFICCIDSDLLALEGTHFNWRKNEWITSTKEQEDYTKWSSMITGTHNGISGLKGKGISFVKKLFDPLKYVLYDKRNIVLDVYIDHYKNEEVAIDHFYANYKCIQLKTSIEGFILPPITEIKSKEYDGSF